MSEHWSCVDCGEGKDARDILEQIAKLVVAGAPPELSTIILAAIGRCATNVIESKLSLEHHCAKLVDALNHAQKGEWLQCYGDLTHGH